jgi:N-methylhydantoinase A/oxoprolinase/acetone carboxylase beta subunit
VRGGGARARRARGTAARGADARVRHAGAWLRAAVWERGAMGAHDAVRGPAVVRESGATLWVPPGWSGRLASGGTLVLRRGGRR